MGGGDLNLKKSWHPSTLRNIERVWKAEQKHEVEQQKIEQLQRELAEERTREEIQTFAEDQGAVRKKDQRLDWMYQGPAAMVNREEYLVGRKIDKTLETLQKIEKGDEPPKDDERDIGSSMFSSQNLSGTATVDLATKIREDPLFSIMKKEKEERKNLLSNPVRMKQLQKMLEASLSEKKSKKHKKNKKKRHSECSSDEEPQKERKKHRKEVLSDSDSDLRKPHWKKDNNYSEKYERGYDAPSYGSSTRSEKSSSFQYQDYRNSKYQSSKREKSSRRDDHDRELEKKSTRQQNLKTHHNYHHKNNYPDKEEKTRRDAAEQERRLQEMQENARWREEQLKKNAKRYREEDEREEQNLKNADASNFIKPMLSKAAGKGSLENRVKQKIFSIQRGKGVMDKHFARRE